MKLVPHLLKEAETRHSTYEIVLEEGTSLEDALKSEFWVHVARRLRVRDQIQLHAFDGTWYAELLVRGATPLSTTVGLIRKIEFEPKSDRGAAERETVPGFTIKARGAAKWCAIRDADKEIMVSGLGTYDDVVRWLKNPPQQIAA